MPSLEDMLKESILDPIQEALSPALWDENEKLKRTVKTHLVKRLESWLKGKNNKPIKNMFLLGSMTGFQFTKNSDIDVNFVLDITDEERKELVPSINDDLNGKPLPGTEHPVNYFLSTTVKPEWKKGASGSVYNILKDNWMIKAKKEEQHSVIANYKAVTEIARFFLAGMDLMISEYNSDVSAYESYIEFLKGLSKEEDKEDLKKAINFKLQEIVADIDGIYIAKHMLRALRQEAFDKDEGLEINTKIDIRDSHNSSINNLIYKYIEKLGYFPKIKEILDQSEKWTKELQG